MGGGLRAISARSAADILSALARPPFRPCLRPSVTAPISFNPIVSAASLGFLAFLGWGKSSRCKRSALHSPSDILGALAEIEEGRRARRGPGQPARKALSGSPLHYVPAALCITCCSPSHP